MIYRKGIPTILKFKLAQLKELSINISRLCLLVCKTQLEFLYQINNYNGKWKNINGNCGIESIYILLQKSGDSDLVQKDDLPVSLDNIDTNLYLGNLTAAYDLTTLSEYKICSILTIDTCPLPQYILKQKHLTTMYIQLADTPKEDILSHFNDSYNFIENGVQKGGVLVHCYFGVSRSAALVLAYIMKKYQLSYAEAYERVKKKRKFICPNSGFVSQLKLYKKMSYNIDLNHPKYKVFCLTMAADKVRKVKILPQEYHHLIKADPGLVQTQPEPNVYRCKKCRRVLATQSNLLIHYERKSKSESVTICQQTFFIEPLSWMRDITHVTQGKLHCPKCNVKLGSFSWIMGSQCPCGCQVAPAFYLVPSKVDFTNVVQNIEMTV